MSHSRSRRSRTLACVLSAAALAALLWPRDGEVPRRAASRRGAAEARMDPEISAHKAAWAEFLREGALRPGDRARYAFQFEREHQLTLRAFAAEGAEPQTMRVETRFDGQILLAVHGRDESGCSVGFMARNVALRVCSADAPDAPASPKLAMEVSEEVLARVSRAGSIDKLLFPENMGADARNHWREVLAHWQVAFPEDPAAREWTAIESDTSGEYEATYALGIEQGALTVNKTRGNYRRFISSMPHDLAVRSGGSALIEMDTFLLRIRGEEWIHVDGSAQGHEVESRMRFEIVRVGFERGSAPVTARTDLGPRATSLARPEVELEAGEEQDSFTDLVGRLRDRAVDGPADPRIMAELCRLFRAEGGAVEEAMLILRDPDADEDLCSSLVCALAASQSEAGQRALSELMLRTEIPAIRRRAAVMAIALVEAPLPDVDDSLRALHEGAEGDLSRSALLLLAAVGNKVRRTAPARSAAIGSYVEAALSHAARDPDAWPVALEAIGNLGPDDTPRAVSDAYRNGEALVRSAALRAVVRTRDASANELLFGALRDDRSERVRLVAVEVIAQVPRDGAREALEAAARGDTSANVRDAALRALADACPPDERAVAVRAGGVQETAREQGR